MLFFLGPVLVTIAFAHIAAALALAAWPDLAVRYAAVPVSVGAALGLVETHKLLPGHPILPALLAGTLLSLICAGWACLRPELSSAGASFWVSWLVFALASATWAALFLNSLSLSSTTTMLLWITASVGALTLPSAIVTTREGWEPLLRQRWHRPRLPLATMPTQPPRVSIHVPTHAEPAEIVIATLDRLAALDYPDFEVLVIDNNTSDPNLWRPLQAHCEKLGERFRFLHIEGITGAKAGALNWALPYADPDAELVAIVDADYHVEPEWLRSTVGYFDDPKMGFVQCPHAYRDCQDTRFGRWADWEYSVFFATGMVSLNEHNAGLTVGTLSVIRIQALNDAGGWAEWCLTEDSELAVRIHAAGYDSVYLTEKYGRGLIPETFASYRKQRFRWTYGPVQEFRRHWRLFLPRCLGATPSQLTPAQKLHHANHGIDVICVGLRVLAVPLGALTAASMLIHHERVPVPVELWAASTVVLISSVLMRYLVYRRIVRATLRQAIGGIIAFAALSYVITVASLKASIARPATWQRTGKFRAEGSGLRVLTEVIPETTAGLACLLAAILLLSFGSLGGVVTMLAIACALQAVTFLASTAVAVTADRGLLKREAATVRRATRHAVATGRHRVRHQARHRHTQPRYGQARHTQTRYAHHHAAERPPVADVTRALHRPHAADRAHAAD